VNLKAGEWVEVRNCEEILATLDERGRLENLPFMPEMLQYCGQRLRVFKRADKTCDNIEAWSIRRMKNSVHLDGVRCDGAEHGGCQAGCLIFWKEAWLKRVEGSVVPADSLCPPGRITSGSSGLCTVESILAAGQSENRENETIYSCQATELRKFTSYMRWWDPRQYIRDLRSGNLKSGLVSNSISERVLETALGLLQVVRTLIVSFFREGRKLSYPSIVGAMAKTPIETLDLQPGELVQIRSREEIIATLDQQNRNRGLLFDGEMLRYCGGIYRVLRRVYHIIDEKTGKMMNMKYPCIVLEGVVCQSDFSRFCPRAIFSYWRENWLRRVSPNVLPTEQQEQEVEDCQRR
jgi:hypothetical protein